LALGLENPLPGDGADLADGAVRRDVALFLPASMEFGSFIRLESEK